MGIIEYNSNNSGGSWWLSDENWRALEAAGWIVHWIHDESDPSHVHEPDEGYSFGHHSHAYDEDHRLTAVVPNGNRWLGALAKSAAKRTTNPDEAIHEFETVTGQSASDLGCGCCGAPHSFVYTDDDGSTRYCHPEVVATEMRWS